MVVQLQPSRVAALLAQQQGMERAAQATPPVQPQEAFVWGQGGRRMTPAEIAREHDVAAALMANGADYSPVQHWTQGAARALGGLTGAFRERRANKAAEANAAEAEIAAALLNPKPAADGARPPVTSESIASILANPYLDETVRDSARAMLDWRLDASKPFTIGRDRVQFDPATGQSSVVYNGPQDFELYAAELGLEPGTPEYFAAVEDFILRSSGPSAHERDLEFDDYRTGNDAELEGLRQTNRERMEGLRQDNRETLEGTRQRNRLTVRTTPPARATGGGGADNLPVVSTPEEARRLPSGTRFRTPDGKVKVVP